MSIVARFGTKQPTLCAVCRRRAWWLGFAPSQKSTIIWLCDDKGCHQSARDLYKMPSTKLDAFEKAAANEAGAEGGAYLDEIGMTDLAKLNELEWSEFLRRLFVGYERSLRAKILSGAAPF